MLNNGLFISVEGIEGVGKSTVIAFIEKLLQQQKIDHAITREPGGTPIAEDIRRLLLAEQNSAMSSDCELLLMFASRAQHLHALIIPELKAGKCVVSDRFVDASIAYQGGGREIPVEHIQQLATWLNDYVLPKHTLLLDAPVEVSLQRMLSRGAKDRIEQEGVAFFERARQQYLKSAKEDPERFFVLNVDRPLEAVLSDVEVIIKKWLKPFIQ